jgi:agmatinase
MCKMMNVEDFDPDGVGQDNGNYFGLPFTPEESALVLLSVPWDVTASYGSGARFAPDAIIGASVQLDLYDAHNPDGWKRGIGTIGIDYTIEERSTFLGEDARKVMKALEQGGSVEDEHQRRRIDKINEASAELNDSIYAETSEWLERGKIVGLVGGDHSTPLGFIRALAERERAISILHIDAHADLRRAYEGFSYSHASIMYNVLESARGVERIVQVGVRDQSAGEARLAASDNRVVQITDLELAERRFAGDAWDAVCSDIIANLGDKVYISFDIDGLSPDNSPHTGTPVPGGLSFNEAVYLIYKIAATGRRIVGFDLCEVCPAPDNEWDANVGARILYKLCNLALKTNPK